MFVAQTFYRLVALSTYSAAPLGCWARLAAKAAIH